MRRMKPNSPPSHQSSAPCPPKFRRGRVVSRPSFRHFCSEASRTSRMEPWKGGLQRVRSKRSPAWTTPPEDRLPVGLPPQDDGLAQARIRREDARRRSQGGPIDIRAHEGPAVLPRSDERIDGVGAHPHIQHADGRAPGDGPLRIRGQQIGEVVHIVRPARDGRAEVAGREVPAADAVGFRQQRAVQGLHRRRVREVDGGAAMLRPVHEGPQFRAGLHQPREVVAPGVAVARMQARLGGRCPGRRPEGVGHDTSVR